MKPIIALLVACLSVRAAIVQDVVRNPDGSAATGKFAVTLLVPAHDGQSTYGLWTGEYTFTDLAAGIDLAPNDTLTPQGTSYQVRFWNTSGSKTMAWLEYWVIPTSLTPQSLRDVRVAVMPTPSVAVALSQLSPSGAADGQIPTWSAALRRWLPANLGGVSVSSVFTRTGAVTAQTGDYTFSQIGGSVGAGQLPAAGGDLSGTLGAATVAGLQGRPVSASAPVDGQMMRWNASATQWQPVKVRHVATFTAATLVSVTGATHQLGTADLTITCYDTATPPHVVEGDGWTIDPTTFDVAIGFSVAQDGKCVLR